MNILTPISGSEETFQDTFDRILQEVAEDLERSLHAVVPSANIHFTTHNLYTTGVYWVGYIDLRVFVESLPTLEKKSPYMYNYLTDNHREAIEEAKRLFAKLKLQEFPLPQIVVEEDNSSHYPKKPSKRRIQVGDDDTVWWYFYSTHTDPNILEVGNQAEEYLKEVEPVLEGLCKMIASTSYEHLMSVSKSLRAEYS